MMDICNKHFKVAFPGDLHHVTYSPSAEAMSYNSRQTLRSGCFVKTLKHILSLSFRSMEVVLALVAQALRHLSLKFLQFSEDSVAEGNFDCGAQNLKKKPTKKPLSSLRIGTI